MFLAIREGRANVVNVLLDLGVSTVHNNKTNYGHALNYAAALGRADIVEVCASSPSAPPIVNSVFYNCSY